MVDSSGVEEQHVEAKSRVLFDLYGELSLAGDVCGNGGAVPSPWRKKERGTGEEKIGDRSSEGAGGARALFFLQWREQRRGPGSM